MIYLLLSVCFSSIIMLVFKGFKKYDVKLLPAVVFNYGTCGIIGLIYLSAHPFFNTLNYENWMIYALLLGFLFISVFYGMGYVTHKMGVSTSTVAAKMGVVFPVIYGLAFLQEHVSFILIIGILCSIFAVVLISGRGTHIDKEKNLLPVLWVFIGSGIIDICIKVISDKAQLPNDLQFLPTLIIFASAFVLGSILLISKLKKDKPRKKDVFGGILLGVPNFFSIYFILLALNVNGMKASFFYPVNNVSIVLLSTLLAILLFKEKLGKRKALGLAVAVLSIVLINQGNAF